MGWSCRADASKTLDAWSKICLEQTKVQNTFIQGKDKFFFETSRREHADGAITGTIYKFLPNNMSKRSGSFRIEGSGEVTRGPKSLKQAEAIAWPEPQQTGLVAMVDCFRAISDHTPS